MSLKILPHPESIKRLPQKKGLSFFKMPASQRSYHLSDEIIQVLCTHKAWLALENAEGCLSLEKLKKRDEEEEKTGIQRQ